MRYEVFVQVGEQVRGDRSFYQKFPYHRGEYTAEWKIDGLKNEIGPLHDSIKRNRQWVRMFYGVGENYENDPRMTEEQKQFIREREVAVIQESIGYLLDIHELTLEEVEQQAVKIVLVEYATRSPHSLGLVERSRQIIDPIPFHSSQKGT